MVCSPTFSEKLVTLSAHLLVYTNHEYPYQNNEQLKNFKGVVIRSPGEYEVDHTTIVGVQVERVEKNKSVSLNTAFRFDIEDISVCYLGSFLDRMQTSHYEQLGNVDIVFVPVHKEEISQVTTVVKNLEPAILAVFSADDNQKDTQAFCEERGLANVVPVKTYTIKKTDLNPEEEKVVVFA